MLRVDMPNESPLTNRPVVSVIRGEPSDAELAAVIAVLAAKARAQAAAAGLSAPTGASRSAWSMRSALMREILSPGPGAWKRSGLPR
jgi:hypothetical protein